LFIGPTVHALPDRSAFSPMVMWRMMMMFDDFVSTL